MRRCHRGTVNSHHRDRIVDREVMKLRLREAKRRNTEEHLPRAESRTRPPAVLVAVDLHDSAAAATTVAAAGVLAAALAAEVILAAVAPLVQPPPDEPVVSLHPVRTSNRQATIDALTHSHVTRAAQRLPADVPRRTMLRWGAPGPAIVEAARQERVDLVVVSLAGGADRYVLHHSEVPVLVVPGEPPAGTAA
jgi:nucleotide-binding universal stress UspA family protein